MMDEFDNMDPIRDEAEYWDALANRVTAVALAPPTTVDWLAESRVGWVAALVVLTVFGTIGISTPSPTDADWPSVLAPSDRLGQALFLAATPPSLGDLLLPVEGPK